jgi:hypothetical protein
MVLAVETRVSPTLHQTYTGLVVLVGHARDANIARTFLHDYCKNNPFFDADLSRFFDGIEDASDILVAGSSLEHLMHVDAKDRDEVFSCVLAGEGRCRAGEKWPCTIFVVGRGMGGRDVRPSLKRKSFIGRRY